SAVSVGVDLGKGSHRRRTPSTKKTPRFTVHHGMRGVGSARGPPEDRRRFGDEGRMVVGGSRAGLRPPVTGSRARVPLSGDRIPRFSVHK
ncbi:hypothetical protein GW17_00060403, partial [Ensete ventricosum]